LPANTHTHTDREAPTHMQLDIEYPGGELSGLVQVGRKVFYQPFPGICHYYQRNWAGKYPTLGIKSKKKTFFCKFLFKFKAKSLKRNKLYLNENDLFKNIKILRFIYF